MYALADMYMIRRLAIRITELHLEQHGRMYLRIGYAQYAVWEKTFLNKNKPKRTAYSSSSFTFLPMTFAIHS